MWVHLGKKRLGVVELNRSVIWCLFTAQISQVLAGEVCYEVGALPGLLSVLLSGFSMVEAKGLASGMDIGG